MACSLASSEMVAGGAVVNSPEGKKDMQLVTIKTMIKLTENSFIGL